MGCVLSVDALHLVYKNKVASEAAIASFRKYNPNSTYVVICDGGDDYSDICRKYQCVYIHSPINIGYPSEGYGYRKQQMMEYLRRFSSAVTLCKSDHVLIMEDDVCVINNIIVPPNMEMFVTENCKQNYIHPVIIDAIQSLTGKKDIDNHYGLGGGGIFKRKTFENIYSVFSAIMDSQFEKLQEIYPTIGWTDCINSIAMMMAGAKHEFNPQVHELSRWGMDHSKINYDDVEERLCDKYSILHHYKKHYTKYIT